MSEHQEALGSEADRGTTQLGEVWATLELCAAGLSTAEVADRLGADPDAVRRHVERAKAILGAGSKLEAVVRAVRAGLIAFPSPARP